MYCLYCNKRIVDHGKKYCSYICYGFSQRKRVTRECFICKKLFDIHVCRLKGGAGRTCSRKCHYVYQSIRDQKNGENHHLWRGGRHIQKGYVWIRNQGYEHRVVMEIKIGRKLKTHEVVHHIDGDKINNIIGNLKVMTDSEHVKLHRKMRKTESAKH